MVIAFYFICEQIEPAEPKLFKCRAACRTVSIIVVAWNKRYADDAVALPPGSDYQAEVGCHKVVGLPGIALVYAGIHVLYVYYERVYHRNESLHPFARHIERSLYVDAPRRALGSTSRHKIVVSPPYCILPFSLVFFCTMKSSFTLFLPVSPFSEPRKSKGDSRSTTV